jgi:hypothetical protein
VYSVDLSHAPWVNLHVKLPCYLKRHVTPVVDYKHDKTRKIFHFKTPFFRAQNALFHTVPYKTPELSLKFRRRLQFCFSARNCPCRHVRSTMRPNIQVFGTWRCLYCWEYPEYGGFTQARTHARTHHRNVGSHLAIYVTSYPRRLESSWKQLWLTAVCFPVLTRPGHEADHSVPRSVRVKNAWSFACTPFVWRRAWHGAERRGTFQSRPNLQFTG